MLKNSVKYLTFLVFSFVFLGGFALPVQAEPKYWYYDWGEWNDRWKEDKKYSPYLEHPKEPVHGHWQARPPNDYAWQPDDWIAQRKSGLKLIHDFYRVGIFKDQTIEDGTPVLTVGPQFYRLSGFDQERVMQTLDEVYEITSPSDVAIVMVKDWRSGRYIGVFSNTGLQLQ